MGEEVVKRCDAVIVGGGPAGMFAARELLKADLDVVIVDAGKPVGERSCPMMATGRCEHCEPCDIMGGIGGAGVFSDGTLNLRPDVGGDLRQFTGGDEERAQALVDEVDGVFLGYGAPSREFACSGPGVDELKRSAAAAGAQFVSIRQRHLGSDKAPEVIGAFAGDLEAKGLRCITGTRVVDLLVEDGTCAGVRLEEGGEIRAGAVLVAPGRVGTGWVNNMVDKYSLPATHNPVDLGVRVEVPAIIMDPITELSHDPKFHIYPPTYDDFVRTFCTNRHGFVVKESYEGHIGVNGHSFIAEHSANSNFAMLVQIKLTRPVENTTNYGRSIAKLATTIGGGKPIVQRLGDRRSGRRSTPRKRRRNLVAPTLMECTPGDISMALPHRLVTDIVESLEILDRIIPGVAAASTLLYAPEVKFYTMRVTVDATMQTGVKGLFAAGDGAGLSRDIVNASATGLLAGRGIAKALG